jgi:iron(III) transport system ATP-binding protein
MSSPHSHPVSSAASAPSAASATSATSAPSATDAATASAPALQVSALCVRYPQASRAAVEGLTFALAVGEIACLIGASGCGKTSVLRAIAGFLPISSGRIALGERCLNDATSGCHIAPQQRGVGLMFQDLALFPHLTVAQNIGFGLRHASPANHGLTTRARSKREQADRVAHLLAAVSLHGLENRYPHELSGGQQQRVALARALAAQPRLLLLDEPFSSLDANLRRQLALDIRLVLKAEGVTALMVTHDQHEAFAFADTVGVMHHGRMEQWATPYTLYHEPATRYVAQFIGEGAFLAGRATLDAAHEHQHVHIELGDITPQDTTAHAHDPSHAVDVLLRPDDVVHDDASPLQAVVVRKAFRGAQFLYTLRLPSGSEVLALVPSHHDHAVGEAIGIRLEAEHVVTFATLPRLD